jgi:hypothetical protein
VERMIAHALVSKFLRIPKREVVMYDWHSAEGREFLEAVQGALDSGTDIVEVGAAIGVRDFSSRWKVIGRKR